MFVDEAQAFTKTDSELVAALKAAKALIADPKNWITNHYAEAEGSTEEIDPRSPNAARFCMIGALGRVTGQVVLSTKANYVLGMDGSHPLVALMSGIVKDNIPKFNDSATHAEVMSAFDQAIAKAEKL